MDNSSNNKLAKHDEQSLEVANQIGIAITKKHKRISSTPTPPAHVKKKDDGSNTEYCEIGFLKGVADQEYPGWSWIIKKSGVIGSEVYEVHGKLKWYDEGIWREGHMVAAHRIAKKRGTDNFVDVGNDIKAANTDCMKKAFNMFLNIADDIYRNQFEDSTLTDKQKNDIIEIAASIDNDKLSEITGLVTDQKIHAGNYRAALAKITREAKEWKEFNKEKK